MSRASGLLPYVSCLAHPGGLRAAPAGGGPAVARGRKGLFTIDIHCHVLSERAERYVKENHKGEHPQQLAFANAKTREINRLQGVNTRRQHVDLDVRRGAMDGKGVDVEVLSPTPGHYYYWCEAGVGREASKRVNDDIAGMVASDTKRFVGFGTLPMQDAQMAVAEMRRGVKDLGLKGFEINSSVNDEELSAQRLEPFWAEAEVLGCVIFLHPTGFGGPRFRDHYLSNVVGNPLNSTIALSWLIFDGTLERHPGLKLVVAHGGGFLPTYSARMDHAHAAREDCRVCITRPPSEYLKRLYFDTVVFDPEQIAFLAKRYGVDRVLLGTDYPYDMAEDDPVGLVMKVPGLSDEQRSAICGGNAARLLGIEMKV